MKISVKLSNHPDHHQVTVATNGVERRLDLPPKVDGRGSAVNGGELLFAALATCYCNDIYREAAKRRVQIHAVDVDVEGEFGGPGEPARNVVYRVAVSADASDDVIEALIRDTDTVAEVQNSLRAGVSIILST